MLALLQIYPSDLRLLLCSRVTNACVSRWATEIETLLNSDGNTPPAYMSLLNHYECPQYDVRRLSIVCSVTWTRILLFLQAQSIQTAQDQRQTWDRPHDPYHGEKPKRRLSLLFHTCMRVLSFKFLGVWCKIPSKNDLEDLRNHPVLSYSFKDVNWIYKCCNSSDWKELPYAD